MVSMTSPDAQLEGPDDCGPLGAVAFGSQPLVRARLPQPHVHVPDQATDCLNRLLS